MLTSIWTQGRTTTVTLLQRKNRQPQDRLALNTIEISGLQRKLIQCNFPATRKLALQYMNTIPSLSISIVIPVLQGGDEFRQCLNSIAKSLRAPDELIVVSDGANDDSWKIAKTFDANVIRLDSQGGPARARNIGAKAAQGDILFFVDADVTLHPDTIGLVERQFQQSPDLTALIGSYDDAPGAKNFLSQYKNLFHHYTHQTSSENASTFWGACGAIRRSVFSAVGGFEERYLKPSIEDIELGYRLKRAGYAIRLCKNIQVKHLKKWEPLLLLRAEILYRALPWSELLLQHRYLDTNLNLSRRNRASVFIVFALVGTLVANGFTAWPSTISVGLILTLLAVNLRVYRFYYRKRGLLFTLLVIPWHWFYFLYGGGVFAYATLKHYMRTIKTPGHTSTGG